MFSVFLTKQSRYERREFCYICLSGLFWVSWVFPVNREFIEDPSREQDWKSLIPYSSGNEEVILDVESEPLARLKQGFPDIGWRSANTSGADCSWKTSLREWANQSNILSKSICSKISVQKFYSSALHALHRVLVRIQSVCTQAPITKSCDPTFEKPKRS